MVFVEARRFTIDEGWNTKDYIFFGNNRMGKTLHAEQIAREMIIKKTAIDTTYRVINK